MAIYIPGIRNRRNRPMTNGKRNMVAVLSLTAMVDMFTVLAVFLLQNYQVEEIQLNDIVPLPKAEAVKKLMPAHVVTVTKDEIMVGDLAIERTMNVKEQEAWLIDILQTSLNERINTAVEKVRSGVKNAISKSIRDQETYELEVKKLELDASRVTLQADKNLDFLTLKKILYTVTEAGASEINFAVIDMSDPSKPLNKKRLDPTLEF